MSVKYDLYATPSPDGKSKKVKLHARIKTTHTVGTEKIAKKIQSKCSLTEGDVKAVLSAIKSSIIDILKDGDRVHIEGLGYFQMTLQCPPISANQGVRAESVSFKSISFRPEKELKKEFINTHFVRADVKNHSQDCSPTSIQMQLTDYFQDHDYITRAEFAKLCQLTTTTACRRIKELVENGELRREGVYRSPIYTPEKGHYHR